MLVCHTYTFSTKAQFGVSFPPGNTSGDVMTRRRIASLRRAPEARDNICSDASQASVCWPSLAQSVLGWTRPWKHLAYNVTVRLTACECRHCGTTCSYMNKPIVKPKFRLIIVKYFQHGAQCVSLAMSHELCNSPQSVSGLRVFLVRNIWLLTSPFTLRPLKWSYTLPVAVSWVFRLVLRLFLIHIHSTMFGMCFHV